MLATECSKPEETNASRLGPGEDDQGQGDSEDEALHQLGRR
jgi:hypothetical protein